MTTFRTALWTAPLAALVACGGNTETTLTQATPSYQALAMDMTSTDVTAGLSGFGGTAATALMSPGPMDDPCHPHLFLRSDAVAERVNRHLYKFLGRVEAAIANNPTLASAGSVTWERTRGTEVVRFTVARTGTSDVYTWLLELKQVAAQDFTTVFQGSIDRTGATKPHQGTGQLTLDLTALHDVEPLEPATGIITASFSVSDAARKIAVDASSVQWDTSGEMIGMLAFHPRSARYVYYREPGKGGSLKIQDQMPFACPSNPAALPGDVSLVARWYRTAAGAVHGRSDAQMTGGQLPQGERIVGVTCSESASESGDLGERFWLMKGEDANGATVPGLAFADTTGLTPCDPALGAKVPSLTDASNDFDFGAVDFTTADPYPFPGM